jgi:hypothetical protein
MGRLKDPRKGPPHAERTALAKDKDQGVDTHEQGKEAEEGQA